MSSPDWQAHPPGARHRSRPGRPRGPRRSREVRREELLDAAERAIRRVGPHASMDELAAEAGITKPILYSHFGDRAGMAEALGDRTADMLIGTVGEALRTAAATGSAEEVARSAVLAFCNFIESEPSIYRFLVRSTFNTGTPVASRLSRGVAERIKTLLERSIERAGGDPVVAEPWAYAMVGLGFAGAEWWLMSDTMSKEELVDHLTQLLWTGLAGAGLGKLSLDDAEAFVDLVAPLQPDADPGTESDKISPAS